MQQNQIKKPQSSGQSSQPSRSFGGGGQKPGQGVQKPGQSSQARPQMGSRPVGSQQSGGRPNQSSAQRDQKIVYINDMIKAPKVLLIDDGGEKMGVVSRDEALKRAYAQGLDLVQLAYNPVDMVCTAKIVDYGKYQYMKQKDDKEKKKNQKSKGGKDIKISYTIGDNDLQLKIKKAIEFLEDGYTVRFIVKLKGREKIFTDKVVERLKGVETQLETYSKSQGVKSEPSGLSLFLLPKSK